MTGWAALADALADELTAAGKLRSPRWQLGQPGWNRFGLTVTPEGQSIWLDTADGVLGPGGGSSVSPRAGA